MQTKNIHLIFSATILLFCITYETALSAERLTLQQSIDLALRQSVLIQSAQEGVKGAEAQKREAFTGFLPKFSTYYSYSRLNADPTLSATLPVMGPVTLVTGTKDNYSWAVEVKQPIFAGGGILANYEAGRLGHEIASLDETTVVQDMVQEVRVAYFNVLKAERGLDVARQSVEQLDVAPQHGPGFF